MLRRKRRNRRLQSRPTVGPDLTDLADLTDLFPRGSDGPDLTDLTDLTDLADLADLLADLADLTDLADLADLTDLTCLILIILDGAEGVGGGRRRKEFAIDYGRGNGPRLAGESKTRYQPREHDAVTDLEPTSREQHGVP